MAPGDSEAGTHLGCSRPETARPRGHRHISKSL